MSNDRLKYLLDQYVSNASTIEELRELFEWIKDSDDDLFVKEKIQELLEHADNKEMHPELDWEAVYTKIISTPGFKKKSVLPRIAIAAAIAGALFFGAYFFLFNKDLNNLSQQQVVKNDILPPDASRAMITLGDGTVVYLDSAGNGEVAMQGNVKIVKLPDGQIGYQSDISTKDLTSPIYNTLTNPKGSNIINLTLSDGSLVWLNAGSAITYPVIFTGNERKVTITGEAFFDVKSDHQKKFMVEKDNMVVEVLGTEFNVNAYDDEENIKVTLMEGSVSISDGTESRKIVPGQQALLGKTGLTVRNKVNLDAVMAWKNGRFVFEEENIHSVMRQLSRWYDVEVNYEDKVTTEKFVGIINRSRYQNISKILDLFEKTGLVKFSINDKNVTVMPSD